MISAVIFFFILLFLIYFCRHAKDPGSKHSLSLALAAACISLISCTLWPREALFMLGVSICFLYLAVSVSIVKLTDLRFWLINSLTLASFLTFLIVAYMRGAPGGLTAFSSLLLANAISFIPALLGAILLLSPAPRRRHFLVAALALLATLMVIILK